MRKLICPKCGSKKVIRPVLSPAGAAFADDPGWKCRDCGFWAPDFNIHKDKMKIRKATKKDLKEMLEIIKVNSPKYPILQAKKELNEMFSKSLLKPTYLVAEKGKEIVGLGGFIQSWADNIVINMFWINVHPECSQKNIGTKIINELIKEIKKLKDPKAKLIIISTKIPLFYKKFGFKKITKYDREYMLMEKKLK